MGRLGEARIVPGLLQRIALGEAEALLERDLKGRRIAFDGHQVVGFLCPHLRGGLALQPITSMRTYPAKVVHTRLPQPSLPC